MKTSAVTDRGKSARAGRWTYVLGATALAAVLASTTACGSGSGGAGAAKPPRTSGSATAGATTPATTAGRTAGTPAGDAGTGEGADACTRDDLASSATNEDGEGRDPRHLLLTLTNAGDKVCSLYRYPYVRLGAYSRSPVPVIEDSDPRTLLTLAPGEEAYAALLVNGGKTDAYETKAITLRLQNRDPGSTTGDPVPVDLPAVGSFDEGARVTYWTTAQGYALDFIMSL